MFLLLLFVKILHIPSKSYHFYFFLNIQMLAKHEGIKCYLIKNMHFCNLLLKIIYLNFQQTFKQLNVLY